jgi:DNA-binding transcriptional regulator YdaS (Cro superfamily)
MRSMDALDRAIEIAGGLTALADRINQSPQTIVHWRKRGVPAERVLDVERATLDPDTGVPLVTRHELNSDIYPWPSA